MPLYRQASDSGGGAIQAADRAAAKQAPEALPRTERAQKEVAKALPLN
jgi:hypothetical protein